MGQNSEEKKSNKERTGGGELFLRVLLEIAGSPKEHIEKAITLLVDKLEEADYLTELVSEEILEAEEHKDHKGIFTAIAEVEIWIKKEENLVDLAFDFMPASIEVIEPERSGISNKHLSNFMNELLARLHHSEMFVKDLSAQSQVLERNSNVLLRNFIIHLLTDGKKSPAKLSKTTGIPSDQLTSFLELLEQGKEIKKEGSDYLIVDNKNNTKKLKSK